MSGAARGTLYHWLFEHFDFTGDLRAQLSSFMQQELISTEERKRIRIADFEYFVQTSLGKKVKQAQEEGTYHREMPFILGVPAKEMIENDKKLSEKDENEYVSVQGVIDAWIDGEDYITLIDFKTDKKPEDMTDEEFKELLKKRYQVQLSYYKRALMQMTKRPVKDEMDNEELEQDKAKDEALEKALEQDTENETPSEDETFAKPDYESEIIKIIRSTTSPKVTREKLEDYHANDIADVLEKLTVVERKKLYNILNMDMLSDVFECIDDVSPYLEEMDIRKAVEIISSLEADTAVAAPLMMMR